MRKHRSLFLPSLVPLFRNGARKYQTEPPPEFLFEPRIEAISSRCSDRKPGMPQNETTAFQLRSGTEAPYAFTRKEEFTLTQADVPTLTVTTDPYNSVNVAGISGIGWKLSFCATGQGDSESEAKENLSKVLLERLGNYVRLKNPMQVRTMKREGFLLLEAPADAPLIVHASYSAVIILDMKGPVRVAAPHARATLLNTSGQVSAVAYVVDFSGSFGDVDLNADAEINLKLTATHFAGHLRAWAQQSVRLLVPQDFKSSLRVVVNRSEDFICRADFSDKINHEKQGNLHMFNYAGEGDGSNCKVLELRSEQGTVAIYGTDRVKK